MSEAPTTETHHAEPIYDPRVASTQSYRQHLVIAAGLLFTLCAARLFLPLGFRDVTIAIWIGAAVSLTAAQLLDWWMSSRYVLGIRAPLRARCESVYGVDLSEATYVGLPSGAYEADYDRGFLLIEPGMLRYFGERKSLGLRPQQLIRTKVHPKGGGLPTRTEITWRQTKVSAWTQFTFVIREPLPAKDSAALTDSLASRIEAWAHGPAPETFSAPPMPIPAGIEDAQSETEPSLPCAWWLVVIPAYAVCALITYGLAWLLYGRDPFKWLTLYLMIQLIPYTATGGLIGLARLRVRKREQRCRGSQPGHG